MYDAETRGTFAAFIYTCKAALAALAAYLLCEALVLAPEVWVWAAVSAVIVMQPELHTSLRASSVRVRANLIGAIVGGVLNAVWGNHHLLALGVGIMIVGMIVHHTRLDDGLRAAYAAVAIVTLTMQNESWHGSVDRILSVLLGCLCAVLINFICDKIAAQMAGRLHRTGGGDDHAE